MFHRGKNGAMTGFVAWVRSRVRYGFIVGAVTIQSAAPKTCLVMYYVAGRPSGPLVHTQSSSDQATGSNLGESVFILTLVPGSGKRSRLTRFVTIPKIVLIVDEGKGRPNPSRDKKGRQAPQEEIGHGTKYDV